MDIYSATSLLFSGLALVVSASALILSLLGFRRDRSDLRIRVEYQHESGFGTNLHIVLANHGRRPVSVDRVRLHFKSGKVLSGPAVVDPPLPATLQEADLCTLDLPLYDSWGKLIADPLTFSHAEARDILGKRYIFPARTIRSQIGLLKLRRQIRREHHEPHP